PLRSRTVPCCRLQSTPHRRLRLLRVCLKCLRAESMPSILLTPRSPRQMTQKKHFQTAPALPCRNEIGPSPTTHRSLLVSRNFPGRCCLAPETGLAAACRSEHLGTASVSRSFGTSTGVKWWH